MRTYLMIAGVATLLALTMPPAVNAQGASNGYVIANQGAIGLAKAFDDGQNTVLVFADLDSQAPVLTDPAGKSIKYRRVADYAVLPGHYAEVKIDVGGVKGGVAVANRIATDNGSGTAATAATTINGPRAAPHDGVSAAVHPKSLAPPIPETTPPPPPPVPRPKWTGEAGTDAKTMLVAWAKKAGWHVDWVAPVTFPISSPVSYEMSFKEAVATHYSPYMDRARTKTPVCIDMWDGNVTIHVYLPDDANHCKDAPVAQPVLHQRATGSETASVDAQVSR